MKCFYRTCFPRYVESNITVIKVELTVIKVECHCLHLSRTAF